MRSRDVRTAHGMTVIRELIMFFHFAVRVRRSFRALRARKRPDECKAFSCQLDLRFEVF